jgi:predicted DNA-binding ribbon-helix-helix protein
MKEVTLHLDEFGQQAFDRLTAHRKGSSDAALRTACLYYLADRDSRRAAWRAPRFAPRTPLGSTLHLTLDDPTWDALSGEARHQAVTVEQLALHAVVYYLADLDSGRLAGLLEEALEELE